MEELIKKLKAEILLDDKLPFGGNVIMSISQAQKIVDYFESHKKWTEEDMRKASQKPMQTNI